MTDSRPTNPRNAADEGEVEHGATFTGACDGGTDSLFYAGARDGWVRRERFLEIIGCTPVEYCLQEHPYLIEHPEAMIIAGEESFPNPSPGVRTFLGFLPVARNDDGLLCYAIHANLGRGGGLVDATLGSPGLRHGRRSDLLEPYVRPHSDPLFDAPADGWFLIHSRKVVCLEREEPNAREPVDHTGLQTFIGAHDGKRHYYAGSGRNRGWVTLARFRAIHGDHPADYCSTHYSAIVDTVGHVACIGRTKLPDPFPGQPTYLGLIPRRDGWLLTVHVNAGKVHSNETRPAGFQVQDATRNSPGFGARGDVRLAAEACGPPVQNLPEGTLCYKVEVLGAPQVQFMS